jgi:tau tubulin kinase
MQKSEGLPVSTVIKNKWKIQGKIGQGSFGEIYAAVDLYSGDDVAIKVEKLDTKKMVLKLEVIALKKLQSCPYVVRYIHSGRQDDFNFLVMERLGENLADIRKRTPRGCFSLCTTLKLGIQMIDALEGVHKLGYIHRDIKPSNFVVGRVKKDTIYLIDFGLARKYRLPSGEIRPPRKSAGFRGTARYASINSHHSKELGRRDDLWCVFYVLVEFALGSLPWRKVKDKEHIGELKERYTNAELVKDLPAEFLQFMQHLQKLGYADEPDYDYLRNILFQVYSREGYPPDAPFDWNVKDKPRYLPPTKEMRPIMDGDPSTKPEDGKNSTKQPPKSGTKTNDSQDYYNIFQNGPNNPNDKPAKNVDSEHDNGKTKCRCCIM